jgi:hypothetical protein
MMRCYAFEVLWAIVTEVYTAKKGVNALSRWSHRLSLKDKVSGPIIGEDDIWAMIESPHYLAQVVGYTTRAKS